jgi:hypothetical protein
LEITGPALVGYQIQAKRGATPPHLGSSGQGNFRDPLTFVQSRFGAREITFLGCSCIRPTAAKKSPRALLEKKS